MRKKIIFALLVSVLFIGAGCSRAIKNNPSTNNSNANQPTEETTAQQRRVADTVANLMPVALVLTDGSAIPVEGVERLGETTFGCNDRIGYVRVSRETATDNVLFDALSTLFSVHDSTFSKLYNSLWQSKLKVTAVQVTADDTAIVKLEGSVTSAGECDDPRIKEQIEATVRQYWPKYKILLNGSESAWRCTGDLSGLCK